MGCGISRQNPDMHSDPFACEPHEPPHRRTDIMCSAGGGIDPSADPCANNTTGAVDEVAIKTGTMVWILFHHGEITPGCAVPGLTGRDRTIGCDFVADHQIGALLRERDANAHVVRRRLFEHRLIYLQWFLTADVSRRFAHLLWLRRRPWRPRSEKAELGAD